MSSAAPSNADSAPYQYERLTSNSGEIRLVQITRVQEDAGKDSIVLELDILHTCLDQAGPYLAISYAWGNPERTHKLLVNGAALFVPENTFRTLYTVYHALPSLTTELGVPGEQVSLWIDAICINQSDVDEKEDQVRRMGRIYSQAVGAIGYIGRPPQGKNPFDGFRTLLWMGNDVGFVADDMPADAAHAWFGEWTRDPSLFEQEVGPLGVFAEAFKNLFTNDWFIRCWVVQEMVLARETACLYGHGPEFAAMKLSVLTTLLDRYHSPQNFQHFMAIWSAMNPDAEANWDRNRKEIQMEAWSSIRNDLEQRQSEGMRLLELLGRTCFGKASDARDIIYSLMGIMEEQDRSAIRVDYSDDYTAANLFLDMAAGCLAGPDCHQLLGWAGLRLNRLLSELPSWVPDWSTPNPLPLLAGGLFSASGNHSHPLTVLDDGRRLSARGIPVDAIAFLTPTMTFSADPATPNMFLVLHFAAQICHRLQRVDIATGSHAADTYHFNNEPWHDVMWRTCCMDRQIFPRRRASLDDRPAFVACLERFGFGADALDTVALDDATGRVPVEEMVTNLDDARLEEAARGFELGVYSSQRERVFGMTGRLGLIGSFPKETRAGDIVVVLLGEELPVVLRPLDGAGTGFELLGTCYVHGIMDGEWITHVTDGQGEVSEVFHDFLIH
jgi:hypothetical protein